MKKRDLWILTALVFFLIGVGLVVGFGDYRTGNPKVMGHSSDEIMVLNGSGAEITLQNYIDNSSLKIAQAFRKDGPANNRPIITVSGSSSAFVELNNKKPHNSSQFSTLSPTLDGIGCVQGWKITGCWMAIGGTANEDIYPYDNGCITKKYDIEDTEMSIVCIKIS